MPVLPDHSIPLAVGPLPEVDQRLALHLHELTEKNPDYWAFASSSRSGDGRAYFQYPAMMIPAMQRELIRITTQLVPEAKRVLDVFAGSGTVLGEAMRFGLAATAQDINPLAILLCQTRTGPFFLEELRDWADESVNKAHSDKSKSIDADFPGLQKWFGFEQILQLSRLRRAIRSVTELWARRFLWAALAETVRLTTYSRTSTYKLHIRTPAEREAVPMPLPIFRGTVERNLGWHSHFAMVLQNAGYLNHGHYHEPLQCRLQDSRLPLEGLYDLLVTSPPYGDNQSTVPYGQSSYLALQWIDLTDIDKDVDTALLSSTNEIDRRSLGGTKLRGDEMALNEDLLSGSSSLRCIVNDLASEPPDRRKRVLYFVRDLDMSLRQMVAALRVNAYLFMTVGNRRVGGLQIPLDEILSELLFGLGVVPVASASRRIPSKRMATRNSIAATMRTERLLIFRKEY